MSSLAYLLNKQSLGLLGWDQINMELSEILIIAFTAVSVLAYAGLTWRILTETRKMREAQTEPRVSVSLEPAERVGHGGIELVIRNEGQGPAQNIRFDFQGDPTYFIGHGQRQPIDQIPIVKSGLPYLGPGQSFRFLLGWLFGEAFDRANEEPWTFQVDYANLSNNSKRDTYILDFSQFTGLIVGSGAPIVKIEKHLEALQKDVHLLMSGFNKVEVITQTKEQYRAERAYIFEQPSEADDHNGSDSIREG